MTTSSWKNRESRDNASTPLYCMSSQPRSGTDSNENMQPAMRRRIVMVRFMRGRRMPFAANVWVTTCTSMSPEFTMMPFADDGRPSHRARGGRRETPTMICVALLARAKEISASEMSSPTI